MCWWGKMLRPETAGFPHDIRASGLTENRASVRGRVHRLAERTVAVIDTRHSLVLQKYYRWFLAILIA
jgi:hypothetical protein